MGAVKDRTALITLRAIKPCDSPCQRWAKSNQLQQKGTFFSSSHMSSLMGWWYWEWLFCLLMNAPGVPVPRTEFQASHRKDPLLEISSSATTEQLLRKKISKGSCWSTSDDYEGDALSPQLDSPWGALLYLCGFLCSLKNVHFNLAKNGLLLSRKRERKWNFHPHHYAKPFSRVSKQKQKQKHYSASLEQTDILTHFVHSGLFLS